MSSGDTVLWDRYICCLWLIGVLCVACRGTLENLCRKREEKEAVAVLNREIRRGTAGAVFEEDLGDEALKLVKVCGNSVVGRGDGQCDHPERGCAWQRGRCLWS